MKSAAILLLAMLTVSAFAGFPGKRSDTTADRFMQQSGIRFTENRGQIADADGRVRHDIAFVADAPGARLYFRRDGISYVFTKDALPVQGESSEGWRESYRLDMTLAESNPFARVRASDPLPGYVNFYLPHCPDGVTGIREYSRIVYENVYHNVDMELFSANGRVKYNFIVRPGGNPADIAMRYEGATDALVMMDGALSVMTPLGGIEEAAPYSYTSRDRNEVASRFHRMGNIVRFDVGPYDLSQTLVIDPWATYFGGSAFDICRSVAAGGDGNVFIAGHTQSSNFPVSPGAFQTSLSGTGDGFIAAFDASGQRMWATYFGGSLRDWAEGIAVDGNGDIVITGKTDSKNFPVTAGAFQASNAGKKDAFLAKFTSGGARLWATYYGGGADENSNIVVTTDAGNNIIFTGSTVSTNFPVTAGAFQTKKGRGTLGDAFLVKFNSTGGRIWATYIGGRLADAGHAVTVDASNNILLSGLAQSDDFPVSAGCFQPSIGGGYDGFLMKFTGAGARSWATFYGGSENDQFNGIGMESDGSIVVAGSTYSTNFPVTPGCFQTQIAGGDDCVVGRFSSSGSRLWATFLGGNGVGGEGAAGVSIDPSGNIVVTGTTTSTDFPVVNPLQPAIYGLQDPFLTKLDPTGTFLLWSTYYGRGPLDAYTSENANGVCVGSSGYVTMVGNCHEFPTYNPWQPVYGGSTDGFIVQLNGNGQFTKRSAGVQSLPASVALEQNYPNPFNPSTVIAFTIPEAMFVRVRVIDLTGRVVGIVVEGNLPGGRHERTWSAPQGTSSGIYITQLEARGPATKECVANVFMTLVK